MRIIKKSEKICALNGTFPLISVLIPVYNAEKYLHQCLDSIVNQTYKNIEIICVNDASPDNSLAILNEYTQKDSRVIVIDKKENEGTSVARKTALEHSKGGYVIPIDNDDWLELDMFENMVNEAIFYNLDMVCCGFFNEIEKDDISIPVEAPQFPQDKIERIRFGTFGRIAFACSVWNKLVKREIYEKIVFPRNNIAEDVVITTQTLYYSEKIGSVRNCFYHYRYRDDSASYRTQQEDMKKYLNVKSCYIHQVSFCKEKFGEDLSIFEPELSKCRVAVEVLNPNKSIIVKEFEVLAKFVTESPEEAIKEAANYIIGRVNLNIEKVQDTEEVYLLSSFFAILDKVKITDFLGDDLISVLVPVYNVEKYLRQCLDSIVNQTYKNIEIVCVNDASSDNSLAILNEYAARDSRIIVVDKKVNEGSAQARKTGLQKSSGKYVIPIDSDDWIELDMLEKLIKEANSQGLDMVCCGLFAEFEQNGNSIADKVPVFPENKIERIQLVASSVVVPVITVVNKLVKREVYNKIAFSEESLGEDHFITCQISYYSEKVGCVKDCLYHYRLRGGSLSRNLANDVKKYSEMKANFARVLQFCKDKFGDDFIRVSNPQLSVKRILIEDLNPNKSIVFKELEVLQKFVAESPKEAIKEAANYIIERVKLNMGKVENTEESYLLPSFAAILHKVKNC